VKYWKASPHQWGEGKTHAVREEEPRTFCGKWLSTVPGNPANNSAGYDCQGCANVILAEEKRKAREREWEERRKEAEAQRTEEDRKWWAWFSAYLQSTAWAKRRALVLQRAAYLCEACGERRASQAHHLTYAHVGNEPLFDLRAICFPCHEKLTAEDRLRRQQAALRGVPSWVTEI
jgi:5-methylcytosine-specific restriction endonuclease McrA